MNKVKQQNKKDHSHSLKGKVNIQYVIRNIISQSQDMMETETFPPTVKI